MDYEQSLNWLFSQTRAQAPRDPERMRRLLRKLGLRFPPRSIYVVGTNGKGSCAHTLAFGLQQAGYRPGLFISPHVEDFCERISVSGVPISRQFIRQFVARAATQEAAEASFFEWTFALALEYFAELSVDIAVIEAGVGARHDATNVLENVEAVMITNVALDHLETLGPTLENIALDKAWGIRPGKPVITAATGKALTVIKRIANERNSPLHHVQNTVASAEPYKVNAELVSTCLRLLGIPFTEIRAVALPARNERFHIGKRLVILDGAHNPHAAQALLVTLPTQYHLLFGALPKKDGAACLAVLEPQARTVIITDVAGQSSRLLTPHRSYIANAHDALSQALSLAPADLPLVISGSFYLAGELRPKLREIASGWHE